MRLEAKYRGLLLKSSLEGRLDIEEFTYYLSLNRKEAPAVFIGLPSVPISAGDRDLVLEALLQALALEMTRPGVGSRT